MKQELEEKLFELGKDFIHPEKSVQEALMGFGFECGDGWYGILYSLIKDIKATNPHENFEIVQVKEKFGELSVYCRGLTDEIESLLLDAEEKSTNTCEICGSPGRIGKNGFGWIKTLCDDCRGAKND